MDYHKISSQATVFTFDNIASYLTHVYLIEKPSRYYLLDTYCGIDSIMSALSASYISQAKEMVVINSHFHWDHVWGNCAFKDKIIISHELCRESLDQFWEPQLEKNGEHQTGRVEKTLPNWTFTDRIMLHDDDLEIFHSPGHTQDSISIFDHQERILYVGDNLEKPIIYVESDDLQTYIHTLENYLTYEPQKIVSGHSLDLTEADIVETIKYLQALQAGEEVRFQGEYEKSIHEQNLQVIRCKK